MPSTIRVFRRTCCLASDDLSHCRANGRGLCRDGQLHLRRQSLYARAQLLDMKKLHLYPPVESNGPLTTLIDLQTMLAWEVLQQMPGHPATTRDQFLKAVPPVRLDAFENYIRGTMAPVTSKRVHYFTKR